MRRAIGRFSCLTALLVAMLVVVAGAVAGPPRSFAVGGFQGVLAGNAVQVVAFSAHVAGNGRVVGQVVETIVVPGEPVSRLRGDVDCLSVSANTAAVGFVVRESSGLLSAFTVGSTNSLVVRDDPAGDTFGFTAVDCTTAIATGQPIFPIKAGNIVVHG